jgi:hypothetical protein
MTIHHLHRRARKLRDEFAQIVRDVGHWNATHPNDEPFDVGFDLVGLNLANQVVAAYERGETTGPCFDRLLAHCKAYAESHL